MKFLHTGLFVPKGIKPHNVTDRKKFKYKSDSFLNNKDKSDIITKEAISQGFINDYAMRNYWDLVLGETEVTDASWKNTSQLKIQLQGIEQVEDVVEEEDKTKESLVIKVESDDDCRTVKNKIQSVFSSNTPVYIGYSHLELMLSVKWLGSSDKFFFDDVIDLWEA